MLRLRHQRRRSLAACRTVLSPISRWSRASTIADSERRRPGHSGCFRRSSTPASVIFDALNPATAQNISNYSLINTSQNDEDESHFIATATFVAGAPTLDSTNTFILDYNGHINLTFLRRLARRATTSSWPTRPSCNTPASPTPPATRSTRPTCRARERKISSSISTSSPSPSTSRAWRSRATTTRRFDRHRHRTVVFRAAPHRWDQHARQRARAPHGRRRRLLEPAPAMHDCRWHADQLHERPPVDRVGQQPRVPRHPTAISATWAQAGLGSTGTGLHACSPTTRSALYNFNVTTQTWVAGHHAGGSGTRLVLTVERRQHARGRRLPRLYAQPGSTTAGNRHRHLRHLRQPARRRKPRQPELADQP